MWVSRPSNRGVLRKFPVGERQNTNSLKRGAGRPASPPAGDGKARTLQELAGKLGAAYITVRRMRKNGFQAEPDGTYDVSKAREFIAHQSSRMKGDPLPGPASVRLTKLREEILETQLHAERFALAKEAGEYITKQQFINTQIRREIICKNNLLNLPNTIPPRVKGLTPAQRREMKALLYKDVCECLRHVRVDMDLLNKEVQPGG